MGCVWPLYDEFLGEGLYLGSSKDESYADPPVLQDAINNAYRQGMAGKPSGQTLAFRIEHIFIEGTNPPTDYKVIIKDHPHGG